MRYVHILRHIRLVASFVLACVVTTGYASASVIDLIGDKDQNPPPHPDGHGIVHEPEDLPGFDQRLVGGTYEWTHDVTGDITFPILSARLDLAVVGLIDLNCCGIDNRLFVDNVEVISAFDPSNDGWRLYSFSIDPTLLLDGLLTVRIEAHPAEGWGGVDFSELHIFDSSTVPAPHAFWLLALGMMALRASRNRG